MQSDFYMFCSTEDEAIDACRWLNHGWMRIKPTPHFCVIDGPEDNYAVVDIKSAEEILDYTESGIPYLVVTD